jgi:hypothetical protein
MIYLAWAILNIGLFLFFVFICLRATKLIREKLGLFASIVFVFALLSFVSSSDGDHQKLGESFNFKLDKQEIENYSNKIAYARLDNNLIFSINLTIAYNKSEDTLITATSANSGMAGLVAGHRWKPQNVTVSVVGQTIKYVVTGSVEWKLFGLNIYTQNKIYTGSVNAK